MTPVAYTVALCTHNHADRLVRTLSDLQQLRNPESPWELLFVDNACSDGTPALLSGESWPNGWQVRVVREEKLGLSNARNCALREAQGEYVIFIDDDETPDPDWLCAFERLIRARSPDAFGSRIDVLFEGERPAWLSDELLGFLGELNRADAVVELTEPGMSFHGGNFGVRRTVALRVGAFDPDLGRKGTDNTGGEEVDFYRRLRAGGFNAWWTPEAVIYHRIQAAKLKRAYFLDLHYRQGRMEGIRKRGKASRIPPKYVLPQLWRATRSVLEQWGRQGRNATVRKEMNVAYFIGYLSGWAFGDRTQQPS
jgi:glycosyltransferase involved in cell wall biosynthesis